MLFSLIVVLLVVKLLGSVHGLACHVDTELAEHVLVNACKHSGRVRVRILKVAKLLHGKLRDGVRRSRDRQRDQSLIRVKSRVVVTHVIYFKVLYRLDDVR